jgi:hypothetical protein
MQSSPSTEEDDDNELVVRYGKCSFAVQVPPGSTQPFSDLKHPLKEQHVKLPSPCHLIFIGTLSIPNNQQLGTVPLETLMNDNIEVAIRDG